MCTIYFSVPEDHCRAKKCPSPLRLDISPAVGITQEKIHICLFYCCECEVGRGAFTRAFTCYSFEEKLKIGRGDGREEDAER